MTENSGLSRPPGDPYDDDIDVRWHLLALWKRRRYVIIATLVGAAIGGAVSMMIPPSYEAVAGLTAGAPAAAQPETAARFRQLIADEEMAVQVMKETGFDSPPHNRGLSQFRDAVSPRVAAVTNSLEVVVLLDDRDLAAGIARALAGRVAAKLSEDQEAARKLAQDIDRAQLTASEEGRTRALKTLADFRRKNQGRVEVENIARWRNELQVVVRQITVEQAKLRAIEQQILKVPATLFLKTPPDRGVTGLAPNRTGDAVPPTEAESTTEVLNPLHTALAESLATSRSRLAELEAQRDYLIPGSKADGAVYSDSLQQLQSEVGRAQRLYDRLADAWAEARRVEATAVPKPILIDEASVGVRYLGPHTLQNTGWAMALGFVISVVCIVLYNWLLSNGSSLAE